MKNNLLRNYNANLFIKSLVHERKHNLFYKSSFNLWGEKYLINELSNELKESIKVLQIAETQINMQLNTLKLIFN